MSKSDVPYLAIFKHFRWDMVIAKTVYRVGIRETVPIDKLSSYFVIFIINEQNIARHEKVTEQVREFEKICSSLFIYLSSNDMSIREKYVTELWIIITFLKVDPARNSPTHFWKQALNKCHTVIVYFVQLKSDASLPHL